MNHCKVLEFWNDLVKKILSCIYSLNILVNHIVSILECRDLLWKIFNFFDVIYEVLNDGFETNSRNESVNIGEKYNWIVAMIKCR